MNYSELRTAGITAKQMKAATGHSNPSVWETQGIPQKYQAALKALHPDYNSDPIATKEPPELLRLSRSSGGYHNTTITLHLGK
jgi:hypothetical protein